jgi:hypothetical protein
VSKTFQYAFLPTNVGILLLNHFRLTPISSPSTSNEVSSDTVRGPLSRPLYIATVTSSEKPQVSLHLLLQ